MEKILIVEDEIDLSNSLKEIFTLMKYEAKTAYNGLEAINFASQENFDCIIMDIIMPKMNGIDAVKEIRKMGNKVPIILLTAKSEIDDKVEGFESGADDYLPKPFETKELLARVKALIRRGGNRFTESSFGDITFNPKVFLVKCNGKFVYLTKKEFSLLEYLIENNDKFTSTEELLTNLWNEEKGLDSTIVWVFISNLKKKLKKVGSKVDLKVLRGTGYQIRYDKKD